MQVSLHFLPVIISFGTVMSTQSNNYQVYYHWKQVDFTFPNDSVRNESIAKGDFVQLHCAPVGLKIYKDRAFITTFRIFHGVPSTLNVIPYQKSSSGDPNEGPKLTPFPSWEMQQVGNCSALQHVTNVELDPFHRLWIVDVGRVGIFSATPKNLCPAKLIIYDLVSNKIDRIYEFPAEVVLRDSHVLKDIQVACTSRENCHSYISNLNVTCAIVVYDYKNNDSWYATHLSMQPDPSKGVVTIDGVTVPAFGLAGLGVTPKVTNYSTLYFSKVAGDHVYAVATAVLKDGVTLKKNPTLPDNVVRDLGVKSAGQADGTAMDNRGRWYFGSLGESAVYSIETKGDPKKVPRAIRAVQSDKDMQWPDTFSFDGAGNLLFLSTRFQRYATRKINPEEVNYRLIRFKTGSDAYYT